MATLAPVILIVSQARPEPDYAPAARAFIAAGISPSALRRRAEVEPQFKEVLLGTADAMDAMAVT